MAPARLHLDGVAPRRRAVGRHAGTRPPRFRAAGDRRGARGEGGPAGGRRGVGGGRAAAPGVGRRAPARGAPPGSLAARQRPDLRRTGRRGRAHRLGIQRLGRQVSRLARQPDTGRGGPPGRRRDAVPVEPGAGGRIRSRSTERAWRWPRGSACSRRPAIRDSTSARSRTRCATCSASRGSSGWTGASRATTPTDTSTRSPASPARRPSSRR